MADPVWRMEVDLPATEQASSAARRLLHQALVSWRRVQLFEDAGIVVSELVTNAVQHAAANGPLRLAVQMDVRGCLNIAVRDGSPRLPVLQDPAADAEAGRGLVIIEQLAKRWGVDLQGNRGKRVWAELG
jgi:anti-sigma regulatory factor (Ser/Thr protein kinase)